MEITFEQIEAEKKVNNFKSLINLFIKRYARRITETYNKADNKYSLLLDIDDILIHMNNTINNEIYNFKKRYITYGSDGYNNKITQESIFSSMDKLRSLLIKSIRMYNERSNDKENFGYYFLGVIRNVINNIANRLKCNTHFYQISIDDKNYNIENEIKFESDLSHIYIDSYIENSKLTKIQKDIVKLLLLNCTYNQMTSILNISFTLSLIHI